MELSSKMPPVQVIHINLLFRSEKNVSDDLDYAYSGLSCNMSSTCYGGVYQGEYTPTEVTKLSLKVLKLFVSGSHILEFK